MSISLYSVSAASSASSPSGIEGVGQRMTDLLRSQDARITGDIRAAFEPGSPLMGMPETVQAQFRRLESSPMNSEEKRVLNEIKARISDIYENNRNYIAEKSKANLESVYLEITAKASGKAMSAIQQLLSEK